MTQVNLTPSGDLYPRANEWSLFLLLLATVPATPETYTMPPASIIEEDAFAPAMPSTPLPSTSEVMQPPASPKTKELVKSYLKREQIKLWVAPYTYARIFCYSVD
jgi:hypothetical protein